MKKLLLASVALGLSVVGLQAKKVKNAKEVVSLVTTAIAKTTKSDVEVDSVTTVADFDKRVALGKPMVVKFHAPWCSYCVKMTPIFKEIAKKYADSYTFIEINADDAKDLIKQHGVRGIPLFKFFNKDGKELDKFSGYLDQAAFEKKMKEILEAK